MIVTETVAAEAFLPSMTDERVLAMWEEWYALPEDHPLKKVEDLVLDLSQDVFWAGRLEDIEYRLWELLCMPPSEFRLQDSGTIEMKEMRARLAELRALTLGAPEPFWFDYNIDYRSRLGGSVARQVPLEKWVARQQEHLRTPAEGSLGADA